MNILVIVFTILMLLSVMTYSRLHSFLSFSGIRFEYEKFMKESERKYINDTQQKLFANARTKRDKSKDATTAPTFEALFAVDDEEEEEPNYTPGQASTPQPIRKLNLRPLLLKGQDNTDDPIATSTGQVFGRLIQQVYGNQKFYQDAFDKDPDFVNKIVETFKALKGEKICGAPIDNLGDLAKISFPEVARNAFGKMFQGGEGIPALDTQVTMRSQPTPIRILGASKELLLAIYRDPNIVESLQNRRQELYNAVSSGNMKPEDASQEFTKQFGNEHLIDINPRLLDFTISSTRPGK